MLADEGKFSYAQHYRKKDRTHPLCFNYHDVGMCPVGKYCAYRQRSPNATSTSVPIIDPPIPTPKVFIALTQAILATEIPSATPYR